MTTVITYQSFIVTPEQKYLYLTRDMSPEDQTIAAHIVATDRRTGRRMTDTEMNTLCSLVDRYDYQAANAYLDSIE